MAKNEIQVKSLTVSYDSKPVVWDVNLSIPEGKCVGILGPNGAGKTTMVKTMLGLIKPLSGSVDFFGLDAKDVKSKIAYVPQKKTIDWDFPITVLEVVMMGFYGKLGLFRRPGKEERKKAFEILEELGMANFAHRHIGDLSGGQQQRLFIARALLQEADIFFLDEPFVCVDKTTETLIVDIFKNLVLNGKTVLVVHHDLNTVQKYFDFLVMLNTRLIAAGPTSQVFTNENLTHTFGHSGLIFEEAINLSSRTQEGLQL